MAERPHRYLNQFLRSLDEYHQRHWDKALPYCAFAYGQGVCESTGQTPNFLEYGRNLREPKEIEFGTRRLPEDQDEYLSLFDID